eukprot:403339122
MNYPWHAEFIFGCLILTMVLVIIYVVQVIFGQKFVKQRLNLQRIIDYIDKEYQRAHGIESELQKLRENSQLNKQVVNTRNVAPGGFVIPPYNSDMTLGNLTNHLTSIKQTQPIQEQHLGLQSQMSGIRRNLPNQIQLSQLNRQLSLLNQQQRQQQQLLLQQQNKQSTLNIANDKNLSLRLQNSPTQPNIKSQIIINNQETIRTFNDMNESIQDPFQDQKQSVNYQNYLETIPEILKHQDQEIDVEESQNGGDLVNEELRQIKTLKLDQNLRLPNPDNNSMKGSNSSVHTFKLRNTKNLGDQKDIVEEEKLDLYIFDDQALPSSDSMITNPLYQTNVIKEDSEVTIVPNEQMMKNIIEQKFHNSLLTNMKMQDQNIMMQTNKFLEGGGSDLRMQLYQDTISNNELSSISLQDMHNHLRQSHAKQESSTVNFGDLSTLQLFQEQHNRKMIELAEQQVIANDKPLPYSQYMNAMYNMHQIDEKEEQNQTADLESSQQNLMIQHYNKTQTNGPIDTEADLVEKEFNSLRKDQFNYYTRDFLGSGQKTKIENSRDGTIVQSTNNTNQNTNNKKMKIQPLTDKDKFETINGGFESEEANDMEPNIEYSFYTRFNTRGARNMLDEESEAIDSLTLERRSTFFTQRSFVDFRKSQNIVKHCLKELQQYSLDLTTIEKLGYPSTQDTTEGIQFQKTLTIFTNHYPNIEETMDRSSNLQFCELMRILSSQEFRVSQWAYESLDQWVRYLFFATLLIHNGSMIVQIKLGYIVGIIMITLGLLVIVTFVSIFLVKFSRSRKSKFKRIKSQTSSRQSSRKSRISNQSAQINIGF